ncbi:hypothetical protein BDV34DRAFT_203065 [Aspergillus parasiticus]|uniref:Uncharacterized protein n=1 Tax=Aspergillus parasiticus TaxID=5067 RepID=A0A5N6D827_ASPPA|nr:hypothetical protein BDV34DRAFT_203065 [Aspergillus parasiticus]
MQLVVLSSSLSLHSFFRSSLLFTRPFPPFFSFSSPLSETSSILIVTYFHPLPILSLFLVYRPLVASSPEVPILGTSLILLFARISSSH